MKKTYLYTFYKVFDNGTKKTVLHTDSTLDPEYHGYVNWCTENNVKWELVRNYDKKVVANNDTGFTPLGITNFVNK